MKKSPLKRKTGLRKKGKIGNANTKARKIIATIAEEKGLNYCELRFNNCTGYLYLAPAHRHKRNWYKGNVELLSDFKQWICACSPCHAIIEPNAKLTEEVFIRLRGKEI